MLEGLGLSGVSRWLQNLWFQEEVSAKVLISTIVHRTENASISAIEKAISVTIAGGTTQYPTLSTPHILSALEYTSHMPSTLTEFELSKDAVYVVAEDSPPSLLTLSSETKIITDLHEPENDDIPMTAGRVIEPMFVKAGSSDIDFLFLFSFSVLLSGKMECLLAMTPMVLSITTLPVVEASWFSSVWKGVTKGAGLFGNPLKALFSPGDYFMPTDSLEMLLGKAGEQGKAVVREAGLEARITLQEADKVVDGIIEKVSGKANEFVINLGAQGNLFIAKFGEEFRFTVDDVLKKASKEGKLLLEVGGFQARLTIDKASTELRGVIAYAGNEVRSIAYELPRLSRLISASFVAGAAEEFKHQIFGSSELQIVGRAIDHYIRENPSANLKDLLSYITRQNHLSPQDKATLYIKVISYVNVVGISEDDLSKIYLVIGATALNDPKLFEEVDWYITHYVRDYTPEILQAIPVEGAKAILMSGDEKKFLSTFGMLEASQQISDGSVPIGAVISFPEHVLPGDFCECDGREYPVAIMKDLYTVIGDRYGYRVDKEGKEYFNVPDYRGYFLRGWNHEDLLGNTQEDMTRMPRTVFSIKKGGSHTHEVLKSGLHNHGMSENGAHRHSFNGAHKGWSRGEGAADRAEYWGHVDTSVDGNHIHTVSESGIHKHEITLAGEHTHILSGGDSETRPKNKNVKLMIKYQSSAINLHKEVAELKNELKDVRESQKSFQASLFFSATAVATGIAVVATKKCLKR